MAKKQRRAAGAKEAVVLRLLHGEDMELVSRESGFNLHELKKWLDQYRRGGREALKSHPGIAADLEIGQARELIAKQAMEIEILKKARAFAENRKP